MATSAESSQPVPPRPINRYSALDNEPQHVVKLASASAKFMAETLGISVQLAKQIVASRKTVALRKHIDLFAIEGAKRIDVERIRRRSLLEGDTFAVITDVSPVGARIMSGRPFALRMVFASVPGAPPLLARVALEWAGKPFVIEQKITRANQNAGYVDVRFDRPTRCRRARRCFVRHCRHDTARRRSSG